MQGSMGKVILSLALALMVGGALWTIAEIGVKESYTVVTNPHEASAESNATFSANATNPISFDERAMVAGAWLVILGPAGVGALTVSRKNYPFINTAIRYGPLAVGFLGIVTLGTQIGDVISGDYDWSASGVTDGYHAFITFATGAAITAGATLFNNRQK